MMFTTKWSYKSSDTSVEAEERFESTHIIIIQHVAAFC